MTVKECMIRYSAGARLVLEAAIRKVALKWINANCPDAWFRAAFARETPDA